ncbi:MAG: hypothetical protein KDA52_00940 [Planctomycetaceae bacterium]|nr:hypothetical protein [Planctomycetaceae bacterium]
MTKFHHPTICRIARHLALAIFGFGLLGSVQSAFAQTGCAAGGGGATGGGRAIGRMGANGGLAAQGVQGGQQGVSQVQQLMMVQQFQQSQQRQQEMLRAREMQQARDEAMRRQQATASLAEMNRPKFQSQRKSTAERAAERREMYFRAREAKLAKSQQMDDADEPDDQESPTIANTIAVVLDE